jgi:hypothetical protein
MTITFRSITKLGLAGGFMVSLALSFGVAGAGASGGGGILGTPTNVHGTSLSSGSKRVALSWTAPQAQPAIKEYVVRYSGGGRAGRVVTHSRAAHFSLTLPSTATFTVKVAAVNALGVGGYSKADVLKWSSLRGKPLYKYSCAAGGSISGQTCTEKYAATHNSGYSCNAGDTLSGTTCTHVAATDATGTTTYSCPNGGTLSGSTCTQSEPATQNVSYSCSSGALEGQTCVSTTAYNATYGITSYTCPSGYTLNANDNCVRYIETSQATCQNNSDVWLGSSADPDCEVETASTPVYSFYCNPGDSLTGTSCTHVSDSPATANYYYTCSQGYTLSNQTCTESYSATGTTNYSCPSGTLNGTKCSTVTTYGATKSNAAYSCASGGTLHDTTCTRRYSATRVQDGVSHGVGFVS